MKALEDLAPGSSPARWPMGTAQVHLPHTKINKSNIDDWSSAVFSCQEGQVSHICCVGVIFQDLGVNHSEVDHKNFGWQVSRSHHSQENCQKLSIYVLKLTF